MLLKKRFWNVVDNMLFQLLILFPHPHPKPISGPITEESETPFAPSAVGHSPQGYCLVLLLTFNRFSENRSVCMEKHVTCRWAWHWLLKKLTLFFSQVITCARNVQWEHLPSWHVSVALRTDFLCQKCVILMPVRNWSLWMLFLWQLFLKIVP